MNAKKNAPDNAARIMVVDDEESIRQTVYELLASEEMYAVTAAGADECLDSLRSGFKGLILMDVMMPDKNGWDTIREIEKAGLLEGNIICMLTAMDVPGEQMDGLQEYVIDYITKPFEANVLLSSVRKYLALLEQTQAGN